MKKAFVIISTLVYFAVSSGIIVNLHYCMNRFASADFSLASGKNQCGGCGMHKTDSHGCCHDEVKLVKLQDDQNKTSVTSVEFASNPSMAIVPSHFIVTSFYNANETLHHKGHLPPLLSSQDTHLQNCVFRI